MAMYFQSGALLNSQLSGKTWTLPRRTSAPAPEVIARIVAKNWKRSA